MPRTSFIIEKLLSETPPEPVSLRERAAENVSAFGADLLGVSGPEPERGSVEALKQSLPRVINEFGPQFLAAILGGQPERSVLDTAAGQAATGLVPRDVAPAVIPLGKGKFKGFHGTTDKLARVGLDSPRGARGLHVGTARAAFERLRNKAALNAQGGFPPARAALKRRLYEIEFQMKNPLDLTHLPPKTGDMRANMLTQSADDIAALRAQGYDGILYSNHIEAQGSLSAVIFDMSKGAGAQIKALHVKKPFTELKNRWENIVSKRAAGQTVPFNPFVKEKLPPTNDFLKKLEQQQKVLEGTRKNEAAIAEADAILEQMKNFKP